LQEDKTINPVVYSNDVSKVKLSPGHTMEVLGEREEV
jgi:hypothetical protein